MDPDLVGAHGLVDDVANHLGLAEALTVRVHGDVAEGVETEFRAEIK
jgi:hypothetical protein